MSGDARGTTVLVPVGAASLEVVAWSTTDPHTGIKATVPGNHRDYELTIHTIVRTGEWLSANGATHRVATDATALASSAVWDLLASRLPPIESEDQRQAARDAAEDAERQATEAAAAVHDRTVWELRPVIVGDDVFALHVRSFPEGFGAFADLGPEVITMSGPHFPPSLALCRRQSRGPQLLPEAQ